MDKPHKTGEYVMKGWGDVLRTPKCLRWEERQIVSDLDLRLYQLVSRVAPEMLDEDYETHEDFCAEYSETEFDELRVVKMPPWMYDPSTPLLSAIMAKEKNNG